MWKIAIIDDDKQVLQGMKQIIPWEDLNAEWAGEAMNGQDGLELIRRTQPDIVMTDIYMPVMNGLEMIEALRQEQFAGRIIILSGYSDFEYARQALRLSVTDYLTKPISLPTLRSVLGAVAADLAEEEERRVEQDELQHKLSLYAPFVEKEWIKSAVSGTLAASYLEGGVFPESYAYWRRTNHAVLALDIERDARLNGLPLADINLFRFAVSNIAAEIAADVFPQFEYAELHGTRSAIALHVPPETGAADVEAQAAELGRRLIDAVRGYLKLSLQVGIGSLKADWRKLPDSTEEAFLAIERKTKRLVSGYALFALADEDDEGGAAAPLIRPVKFYQQLAGAIKSGQETSAYELIDEFAASLEREGRAAPAYLQSLADELWTVFAFTLYDVGMVLDEIVPAESVERERSAIARADQLGRWLKEKTELICNSRQMKGSGKHRQAVEFMLQYIHENYAEEITLAELADKVYISRNYLSNIFKNTTGESFNTYLTRVRMEKAKELLMEGRMLVYEVAERVGYKNVPYFSTLFKKVTGMNPTELTK